MTDTADVTLPESERQRQAVASIRGYIYQITASALAWAGLADDETLLLEVADDFAVVTREALTMTQVKDTPGHAATLRTPGVVATINGRWRLRTANRSRRVQAVYLTTALVGRERASPLPPGVNGLTEWRAAATDGRPLEALRSLLMTLPLDPPLADWLRSASENEVRDELLRPMRWETGQPDLAGLDTLLTEQMVLLGERLGLLPSDARRARDAVLYAVMQRIVDPLGRQLTRSQFLETFEVATTIAMPLSAIRNALPARGSLLRIDARLAQALIEARSVPMAPLTVERQQVSRELGEGLASGDLIWLHGTSGAGKTTAAVDAVRHSNRGWYLLELRTLGAEALTERLRLVRSVVGLRDFGGLILDDLPTALLPEARLQLTLLATAVRRADAGLILTAYRGPPPSLAAGFALRPLSVPGFDEEEVGQVIARAGGRPERWKRVIWLSCGGHPQLVAARVTGLKARQWPAREDLQGLLPDLRASDLDSERDAVRERLLYDLNDKARALLFRLSLPVGGFDRALALSVGAAEPALAQPGEALDYLVGPWIESSRPGRFRVSPLVSDAGIRTLSAGEQRAVHRAICEDLARRRPIPGEHLNQLLISGIIACHAEALKIVAMAVILSDEANQKAVLDHLEHLVLLQTDHVLEVGDPDAGVLLRLAQLRVALAKPAETRTRKILDRILIEADATERPDDYKQAAMFSVLKADISPLEPSEWFGLIRQLEAMNTQISPQREQELLGESAYGGSGHLCDFVFTWRAIHIATVRELEEVFQTLDSAEDSVRNRYLATLNDTQLTIRTFVQSAWVRESGLTGFDAIAMADRYVALQDIAMRWKQPELAIECLAGRTTLLSEYASDHSAALATLEAGEALWPGDPRLARERIKILFRLGQHNDVVLESRRYLASDVTDPIERAHALRELAVSSAKLGDAAAAAEFFGKAAQDCAPVSVMADMYAALLADKAQIEFQSGRLETALRTLMEAAAAADALDSETRRGGFVLRMIAGVSAWMVNLLAGGDVEVAGAVVGRCSGAVIETDWPYPVPQKEVIWYQAAAVERQLGLDIGIGDLVDARIRDRRIAVCEITFAFERLADAARSSSEDRLIDAIRNTAQVVAFMDGGGFPSMDAALHQVGPVMPWADLPLRLSPAVVSPVEDAITCFVIGNNLRTLDFSVDALVDRLLATEGLETLASCVRAWGQTLTPDLETLPATLAAGALLLGSPTGDASALMLASFRTWEWLERSVPARRLEAALVTRISDRWIHLCDKAQFGLRLPGITGPAIRTAARETRDRTSLARLMLVADEAVTARMAPSVRKALQDAVG